MIPANARRPRSTDGRLSPHRNAHVYADASGQYRWRLMSAGRIVADSGQSYTRRSDARNALARLLTATSPVDVAEFTNHPSQAPNLVSQHTIRPKDN